MLSVLATPIGNLEDLTPRALRTLREAELIACEDTRRTWQLLTHHEIPRPTMLSYRQGNEERTVERITSAIKAGTRVVLCSDGGYPGISDPGYRLLRRVTEADLPMEVIPGASAVPLALLYSGLPTSSYTFKGFPPRKPGPLRRFFEAEAELPHTMIVFESPYRVGKSLAAALEALGNRQAAVCIEMTKKFERIHRGDLSKLAEEFADKKVRGEVAIVIAGNNPKFTLKLESVHG